VKAKNKFCLEQIQRSQLHFQTYHNAHVQGDQKVSVHLMITVQYKIDELKMAIIEYTRKVDHAMLDTVLENTVRHVNKCLETGGGHFEHYL
jgi:hypothetical protein